ncbi:caspase-3-like [Dendronephthya gigantea]|uniref:caspase-3-like n=1 Tax=Dendronephthya gigantea TaxID=151771 RepID=UPI00106A752D|nr:caspase-3-like [Dendronephthya gigantea]
MDELKKNMAILTLNSHMIRNAFVLVIVNQNFRYNKKRDGALADKENIEKFCHEMKFTVNDISDIKLEDTSGLKFDKKKQLITDDLTAREMKDLFQTILTGDFSSYDAFICFISSHGVKEGILGVDGYPLGLITVKDITDQFTKGSRTLAGKPKIFFTQNCRGRQKNIGIPLHEEGDDGHRENLVDMENHFDETPVTLPTGADMLVAYSTVDGYESYRSTENGSWFIIKLLEVLKKHAHSMSLTDMLAIVNDEISRMVSQQGKKQMSCFTSLLSKPVYFEIKSSEIQPSAEPSSALKEAESSSNNQTAGV